MSSDLLKTAKALLEEYDKGTDITWEVETLRAAIQAEETAQEEPCRYSIGHELPNNWADEFVVTLSELLAYKKSYMLSFLPKNLHHGAPCLTIYYLPRAEAAGWQAVDPKLPNFWFSADSSISALPSVLKEILRAAKNR